MAETLLPGATNYHNPLSTAYVQINNDGTVELAGTTVTVNGLPISTIVFSGAWSSLTAYVVGNVVSYVGDLYISIQAGTNHQPDTSPAFWTKVLDAPSVSGTVTGPDAFGASATPGASLDYSAGDHDHGLPALRDLTITGSGAATIPLKVKASAAQTAHILDVLKSDNTVLASFDKDGNLTAPNVASAIAQLALVSAASVLTLADENPAVFSGSRRLIAGSNITFDTSIADQLTIAASGGGGGIVFGSPNVGTTLSIETTAGDIDLKASGDVNLFPIAGSVVIEPTTDVTIEPSTGNVSIGGPLGLVTISPGGDVDLNGGGDVALSPTGQVSIGPGGDVIIQPPSGQVGIFPGTDFTVGTSAGPGSIFLVAGLNAAEIHITDSGEVTMDGSSLGFFGVSPTGQPSVPAIPTAQDVVDALVALGLVTQ